jgi:predicted nucleotidyltransferase
MIFNEDIFKELPFNKSNIVLGGYRGSVAHGTFIGDIDSIDDIDVMFIVIPKATCYFGLQNFGSSNTIDKFVGRWDIVAYEFKKFINLLIKGNPNVISMLWLDEKDYLFKNDYTNLLIENRELFNSKKIYNSFIGYAHGQITRSTHYNYQGYMGQKRKEMVDKFSYDPKNLSHCIRLLRMGIEFFKYNKFIVKRPDREELLDIKNGKWELDKIKNLADNLFNEIKNAKDNSTLPEEPNLEKIEHLMLKVFHNWFSVRLNYKYDI